MHSFRQELLVTCNSVIDTIIVESILDGDRFVYPEILVSVGMKMLLTMWLLNFGSVDLMDPLASKSNLSVGEDTKMAKGHAVCKNLKGEGAMTVVWIKN
jgi:hypothetical protein